MSNADEIAALRRALRRELEELNGEAVEQAADPSFSDEEWARGCKVRAERREQIRNRLRELGETP